MSNVKNESEKFDRLFQMMVTLNDKIDKATTSNKEDIHQLQITLDRVVGMLDTDELERQSLTVEVDRHEDWIARAAKQTGIRYSHN